MAALLLAALPLATSTGAAVTATSSYTNPLAPRMPDGGVVE